MFGSDYAEEFMGSDNRKDDGHTLDDGLLRVSPAISHPERLTKEKRINDQVRLIDIVPTAVDVPGLEIHEGIVSAIGYVE